MNQILLIERNPEENKRAIEYAAKLKKIKIITPEYSHCIFMSRDSMTEVMEKMRQDVAGADYVVSDLLFQPGTNLKLKTLFESIKPLMGEHGKFILSELSRRGFNIPQERRRKSIERMSGDQEIIRNKISEVLEPLSLQPFIFHPKEIGTRVCAEAILQGKSIFSTNIARSGTLNDGFFTFLEKRLGIVHQDGYFEHVPEKEDLLPVHFEIPKAFELPIYRKNWGKIFGALT